MAAGRRMWAAVLAAEGRFDDPDMEGAFAQEWLAGAAGRARAWMLAVMPVHILLLLLLLLLLLFILLLLCYPITNKYAGRAWAWMLAGMPMGGLSCVFACVHCLSDACLCDLEYDPAIIPVVLLLCRRI
jgi:hypothetical protein